MGLYSRYIFPIVLEFSLGSKEIEVLRRELLRHTTGDVLEIGFGTGLNLPHYPSWVKRLTVIDPNPGMRGRAQRRIQASRIKVEYHPLRGEQLPFPDASFDTVVSTFTLCSIAQWDVALREVLRVLRSDGRFLFLEHGLADREKVRIWQRRLNPLQKYIGDGCHLNRNIEAMIEAGGLNITDLKKFYFQKLPKVVGYFYQGIARRKSKSA